MLPLRGVYWAPTVVVVRCWPQKTQSISEDWKCFSHGFPWCGMSGGSTLCHSTKRAKSQVRGHLSRTAAPTLHFTRVYFQLKQVREFWEQAHDPDLRGWEKPLDMGLWLLDLLGSSQLNMVTSSPSHTILVKKMREISELDKPTSNHMFVITKLLLSFCMCFTWSFNTV